MQDNALAVAFKFLTALVMSSFHSEEFFLSLLYKGLQIILKLRIKSKI